MSLTDTHNLINKMTAGILTVMALSAAPALSAAETSTRSSKSINFSINSELDKSAKDEKLKVADSDTMPALVKEGYREESLPTGLHIDSISYSTGEINIFDASTQLISDFDFDGFYHRFSVTIDADTIHDTSYVFAKLYLSYEGGPWNHYATSDAYHIYSDSPADSFTIETELADGFPGGYYDVRIELFDADFGDWLVSYGPYEDTSLSSLPLEDSYYDDNNYIDDYGIDDHYIETGIAVRAGSASWWLLILPFTIVITRLVSKRFKK